MSVWDGLVGQERAIQTLHAAASGHGGGAAMTHAWLFTGPPGSGRSTAARAFAAALQCPDAGCGTCHACRTVLDGTHPDLTVVATDLLSIRREEAREIVARASRAPVEHRWQIVVVEDADRLSEGTGNVLLKAIEEPPPRLVWLLCAPSTEDVLPTIRSRTRHVLLRTPSADAVARLLAERDGVDPAMAAYAARAAQGHVGRARRLARDEAARRRRRDALAVAEVVLGSVATCLETAAALAEATREEAEDGVAQVNAGEMAAFREALGDGGEGRGPRRLPRGSAGVLREVEDRQKSRTTRARRDALDRALTDLAGLYRDVLVVQLGAPVELTNPEESPRISALARHSTPEATLRRVEAVLACRRALDANAAPLLALEAMTLALRAG